MPDEEGPGTDLVKAGWAALGEGDWERARKCFEETLLAGESPEALEGLGWAGYFLIDESLTFDSRERAHRLYRKRGDDASAARVAAWLAADCLEFRGEPAVASGWLQRAHRLLDGLEPGPDQGWLTLYEAYITLALHEDTATARRLAARAVEFGRQFGVPELEMVGLGIEGRALVSEGELEEGMRLLDEATTAALAGEAKILVCVAWACCYLIAACEQVRDYERASQWCTRVGEFCERHGIAHLLGVCRAKYADVLVWQGRWAEAETELRAAAEGMAASRPPMAGDAIVRLGELRRRQGRMEEAEELFARHEGHGISLLGRAALALDRGRPEEAAELADRYLRRFPDSGRTERWAGLELAARAHARLGNPDHAEEVLEQLRAIAKRAGTRPLQAACLRRTGRSPRRWAITMPPGVGSKTHSTCLEPPVLGSTRPASGSISPRRSEPLGASRRRDERFKPRLRSSRSSARPARPRAPGRCLGGSGRASQPPRSRPTGRSAHSAGASSRC